MSAASQNEIVKDLSEVYSLEQIEKYLQESVGVFEEYRYAYEKSAETREHVGFVQILSVALENLVGKTIWKDVFRRAGEEPPADIMKSFPQKSIAEYMLSQIVFEDQ